jgi:hypothetical protein
MDEQAFSRLRKQLDEATAAFLKQHEKKQPETQRKYRRVVRYLSEYCEKHSLRFVDQVVVKTMDGYNAWRNKENWTWIKENREPSAVLCILHRARMDQQEPGKKSEAAKVARGQSGRAVYAGGDRAHHRGLRLRAATGPRYGFVDAPCGA